MSVATLRSKGLLRTLLMLPVLALAALGTVWGIDRTRPREIPRWDESDFVALSEAPGRPEAWDERWVVVVHPGCSHCAASLASLAAARDQELARVLVSALIVDADAPPDGRALAHLPADETRWDSRGRWRRQWGYRVYGEVFCFDGAGRLLRVLTPFADVGDAARRLNELQLRAPGDE